MQTQEIITLIQERFGDDITSVAGADDRHPNVRIKPERLLDLCEYLKNEPAMGFDLLRCLTVVDWIEQVLIELSYDLMSIRWNHAIAVKVMLDRSRPRIVSVSPVWPAASWHEREAMDLMGVTFDDHPDPRRILMPDDWEGHPLRKDYQDPLEYHGLKIKP